LQAPSKAEEISPELMRYLNRDYWDQKEKEKEQAREEARASGGGGKKFSATAVYQEAKASKAAANAASAAPPLNSEPIGQSALSADSRAPVEDENLDEFVTTLKTQVEIFVNRMKSNSSRGRSIANDSSVQTLFMNTMAMHSQLLKHIQTQEDKRVYFEGLQDKITQVKDARAALEALREEERERKRREAEEAERIRQIQMQEKLEVMRRKKQEYLQYQRQLALQRMQEQEREMMIRQEQVKQQYMMHHQHQQVPGGQMQPTVGYPAMGPPQPQQTGMAPGYAPMPAHAMPPYGPAPTPAGQPQLQGYQSDPALQGYQPQMIGQPGQGPPQAAALPSSQPSTTTGAPPPAQSMPTVAGQEQYQSLTTNASDAAQPALVSAQGAYDMQAMGAALPPAASEPTTATVAPQTAQPQQFQPQPTTPEQPQMGVPPPQQQHQGYPAMGPPGVVGHAEGGEGELITFE